MRRARARDLGERLRLWSTSSTDLPEVKALSSTGPVNYSINAQRRILMQSWRMRTFPTSLGASVGNAGASGLLKAALTRSTSATVVWTRDDGRVEHCGMSTLGPATCS